MYIICDRQKGVVLYDWALIVNPSDHQRSIHVPRFCVPFSTCKIILYNQVMYAAIHIDDIANITNVPYINALKLEITMLQPTLMEMQDRRVKDGGYLAYDFLNVQDEFLGAYKCS